MLSNQIYLKTNVAIHYAIVKRKATIMTFSSHHHKDIQKNI